MAPPRRHRSAPVLIDDLIGEILLRVPPDEPAHLIRAALVCKPWRRIVFDPVFLCRYREFHRTPPLLGFFSVKDYHTKFVPTNTASPFSTLVLPCGRWRTLDCRHGRVLLYSIHDWGLRLGLLLWDPITGEQQSFRAPMSPDIFFSAAVLCIADNCNHLDCRGGPFLVVFVGTDNYGVSWVTEYSSVTGAWSALTSVDKVRSLPNFDQRPSLFTGGAVYFVLERGKAILRYDLAQKNISVIDGPDMYIKTGTVMMAEDGGLGFASVKDYNLFLWSWKANDQGITGWAQLKVIQLTTLLPVPKKYVKVSPQVTGFVEGTDTIFISTNDSIFALKIKSGQVRKVARRCWDDGFSVPYMSFYAPDLVGIREHHRLEDAATHLLN